MEANYLSYNGGQRGGGSGFYIVAMVFLVALLVLQYFAPRPELPQETNQQEQAQVAALENVKLKVTYPIENRTLETNDYKLTMTNVGGGRVQGFDIKLPERYAQHGDFIRSQKQTDEKIAGLLPLQMELKKFGIDGETQFKTVSQADEHDQISFQYVDPTGYYQFDKTFTTTDKPYIVHAKLSLTNRSDQLITDKLAISMFIRQIEGEEPGLFTPGSFVAAKCYSDDKMRYLDSTDRDETETYDRDLKWFAIDESYFTIAMSADYASSCELQNQVPEKGKEGDNPNPLMTSTLYVPVTLAPNTTTSYEYDIYMGPKEARYLEKFDEDKNLPSVIDYGWMEVFAKPMAAILDFFHEWTGNWGIAIIILTLIVRILLWPIAQKSQLSMMRMSKIAPLMQEIQEKYKDDPATMQQKQLELYQTHKVSPFGCLPLLIQMPIFFALYRCIFVTGGLYKAPFCLWINDLSARDPYFVLPLVSVGLLVLNQLLTPSTAKNQQQKIMMYAMPIIFGAMMLFLPSGLCLYMVISSMFSMAQSVYVRRVIAAENAAESGEAPSAGCISIDKDGTIDIENLSSKEKRAAKRRNDA